MEARERVVEFRHTTAGVVLPGREGTYLHYLREKAADLLNDADTTAAAFQQLLQCIGDAGFDEVAAEWSQAQPPSEWRKQLGMAESTMRDHIRKGKLVVDKITSKLWRIRLDSLQRYQGK